jgi:ketopantoate hydroxymethyltransferase
LISSTTTGTSINMGNSTFTSSSSYVNTSVNTSSIETGRVGKGDKSNQKFETVDMNFDSYHISSTILKLLPNSRKPVETKEINKSKAKGSNQVIDLIKKLSDLYESGILTEDEFSNKRKNYF